MGEDTDVQVDGTSEAYSVTFTVDLMVSSTPQTVEAHTFAKSGAVATRSNGAPVNLCSDDGAARDIALIKLDRRIPLSAVRPIHLPRLGEQTGSCWHTVPDRDDFLAYSVGFGRLAYSAEATTYRNYHSNWGWDYENQGGEEFVVRYQFGPGTLDPIIVGPDYSYTGHLPGDSGGGLIWRPLSADAEPVLCGVNSRYYPGLDGWAASVAAADSNPNLQFLHDNHVFDQHGNYMGECNGTLHPGKEEFVDIDSDQDLIPDACDPCPWVEDTDYRRTGVMAGADGPDSDADGIIDSCDACPLNAHSPVLQLSATGGTSVQPDADGDGLGDACDSCPWSGQDGRLGDLKCCTSDDDCLAGGRCMLFDPLVIAAPALECALNHHRCARSTDRDLDGIGDACDNCPSSPNQAQQDTDRDGVGDVCDNCPGTHGLGTFPAQDQDGAIPCTKASLYDTQGDVTCKALHPEGECVPAHGNPPFLFGSVCSKKPDYDGDHLADDCDNCPGFDTSHGSKTGKLGPNCNVHAEIARGNAYPYIGDACDREPCTWFEALATEDTNTT